MRNVVWCAKCWVLRVNEKGEIVVVIGYMCNFCGKYHFKFFFTVIYFWQGKNVYASYCLKFLFLFDFISGSVHSYIVLNYALTSKFCLLYWQIFQRYLSFFWCDLFTRCWVTVFAFTIGSIQVIPCLFLSYLYTNSCKHCFFSIYFQELLFGQLNSCCGCWKIFNCGIFNLVFG